MSLLETFYRGIDSMSNLDSDRLEMQRFGEKLHALRIMKHLSLQQLAMMLGYSSHSYLSELEAGKKVPTAEFVLKIARLFDVTTDYLLKDELDIKLPEGNSNS